jgi:hypothetical protein
MWPIRLVVRQNVHALTCGRFCCCRSWNCWWYFGDNGFWRKPQSFICVLSGSHSFAQRLSNSKRDTTIKEREAWDFPKIVLMHTFVTKFVSTLLKDGKQRDKTSLDLRNYSFECQKLHCIRFSTIDTWKVCACGFWII